VRALGVGVHVILVHEAEPRLPWPPPPADVGSASRLTPQQVDTRIAAELAP